MTICRDETIEAILHTASRFAERELKEQAKARDAYPYAEFNRAAFDRAHEAGLCLLTAPESLCGCGLAPEAWALVLEKIAAADAGFASSLLAHAMAAEVILKTGNEELKAKWLAGESPRLLAFPLYLPADDQEGLPAAMEEGGGYLLTGVAKMVANAPAAEAAVVVAEMAGDEPAMFLVPLDDDSRPAASEMLGLRSCPVGHLDLEDRKISSDHLLAKGAEAMAGLHHLFYPSVTGIQLAVLNSSLDYALAYGRERWQGGKLIHEHSQLRQMYGRMIVEHQVLREAWLRILESEDADPSARLALKILAAELSIRGTTDGVQLLGGYGYTMDYPQERKMRDARQAAELLGSPARLRLALAEQRLG